MRDEQAERVMHAVMDLAIVVRDEGPEAVEAAQARVSRAARGDLTAALTVAAALIHVDEPIDAWWLTMTPKQTPRRPGELQPHGTHAAFNRHRASGYDDPCDACWHGERLYQAARARRRRASAKEAA